MRRVQRGRDRRQDMDAPRGAAARLRSASIKKRSRPSVCRPRCRRCHQDGHYNVVQVIDGTVVTIYSWIHPKKGLVWCLASANGFDVSHLKWGGDETYAEVLSELLAKSPTFLAATGLRLRRGLLCVDDVRLDFQTLERGRCYTIGFRHPNFHPMVADPLGVWNIQSVDLASGVVKAAGLRGIPRQAPYNREDLVRLVGSQGVRRRGIRVEDLELISRRALDDAKQSPCPGSLPAASGSSTPHLITILSSALAGQKSVQTSCMRRRSSIVSASSSTVAARHNKSSRRGIIALGPSSVLPIGATFLSSFLSLRPVLQCMRGLLIMSSTS